MTVEEFIAHLSTMCSMEGIDPAETELKCHYYGDENLFDVEDIMEPYFEDGEIIIAMK